MNGMGSVGGTGTGRYASIEEYAIIGDCRTAALVSREGSLDWLCWPRFDSPAIFAAILDAERGGRFSIRPAHSFETKRSYRPTSNVLTTRFVTTSGEVELTDLFFADDAASFGPLPLAMVIREITGLAGEVEMDIHFEPRGDYGRLPLAMKRRAPNSLTFGTKDGLFHLATDFDFEPGEHTLHTSVRVRKGERRTMILSLNENAPGVFPPIHRVSDLIDATDTYWRRWSEQVTYQGDYREAVVSSALALKLMEYSPSGAIVAAPTTSLPEKIGASYNWDYRYCWLRDASYTVNALFGIGLQAEATAFLQWLLHATHLTLPKLQVMYNVLGKPLLKERELEHLEGYRGSRPVRIGNGAHGQTQLDVYGEVLNAAFICRQSGVRLSGDERSLLKHLARYVMAHWREPDAGIWESRLGDQHHVHSKAMCWLALDRAAALAATGELDLDEHELKAAATEIRSLVIAQGFNQERGAYTSALGSKSLDAAVLRLPLVGFDAASGERMLRTIEAVRGRLMSGDLVFRHENDETVGEGAFLLCSFWLVECLALTGKIGEAEELFEALLLRANDVFLYAEEVEADSGRFLGNFPQAYTHVGLINAALRLDEVKLATPEAANGRP